MSFQIIGDSCCDYPYLKNDFEWLIRVPLTIELDGICYVDDKKLNSLMLVGKMAASLNAPKSACPSPGDYEKTYECGADDIYVVTLSDKLSGSYNSAVVAAALFKEKYPDRNIFVFSSKSASSGEIALCQKIYDLASSGLEFESVVSAALEFINSMGTFFVLENLDVFRKNGRLNHLQSLVVGALRIKLIMGGDKNGNICSYGKELTFDRALVRMSEIMAKRLKDVDIDNRSLFIAHCHCPDKAHKARDEILKRTAFKDCVFLATGGLSTVYANFGGLIVAF